jgi:hypothetical protein
MDPATPNSSTSQASPGQAKDAETAKLSEIASGALEGLSALETEPKGGAEVLGNAAAPLARLFEPQAAAWLNRVLNKPSWKTGEFWGLILGLIALNTLAKMGIVTGDVAGFLDVVSPLVFQYLRQNFKLGNAPAIIDAAQKEIAAK